jgi:molybdopterin converting factor subunit 1
MHVTVRLFASLRDAAGWSQKQIEIDEGTTIGDLLARLQDEVFGDARSGRPVYAAVNHTYADPSVALTDGDEVALFPPVSGGSHHETAAPGHL